ncbi:MAG: hypothetical protein JWM12_2613 [Ilumatobacteraceae bacterium]|nr:hypothetical protein [Ilumatobacteraceae bacterium]
MVGGLARVDVDIAVGTVQLVAGDAGSIAVTLDAAAPDNFEIAHIGDTVTVRPRSGWLSRGGRAQVVVEVPVGTDAVVGTASGDVTSRVELGAVRVRTASGDVQIDRARRVEAHSASGDLRVGEAVEAQLSTASGDVRVGNVSSRLGASSASGDVDVVRVAGGVEAATTSGDVRLQRCDADDITIKTVSGDVTIGLPSGIRVEPEISTLSGTTRLPKGPPPAPGGVRRTVRLRVRTVSGDIRIDRVG